MFVGMPIAIWIGILLGLATAGAGLLFPIACWIAVAVDAYCERDLRKHHRFLPPSGGADENNVVDWIFRGCEPSGAGCRTMKNDSAIMDHLHVRGFPKTFMPP
jgi:hypothetical protein